jgi:hypothetical protein
MIEVVLPQPRMRGLGRPRASSIAQRRMRRLRGMGDDGIDWSQIISTGIQTAGSVAKVAVTPPMYSSIVNPMTGASSVTSFAGAPGLYPSGSIPGLSSQFGTSLTGLLSNPIVLIGGVALLVLAFRR